VSRKHIELEPIPDKVYFTIGEVSSLCAVKPHVIRYWETEFKPLNPVRRRNRRYYRRKDIELIRKISNFLYQDGYTIEGARQRLLHKSEEESPIKNVSTKDLLADLRSILADLTC
jgi:DNA-binding transcriptional MerR regulator